MSTQPKPRLSLVDQKIAPLTIPVQANAHPQPQSSAVLTVDHPVLFRSFPWVGLVTAVLAGGLLLAWLWMTGNLNGGVSHEGREPEAAYSAARQIILDASPAGAKLSTYPLTSVTSPKANQYLVAGTQTVPTRKFTVIVQRDGDQWKLLDLRLE